MGILCLTICDSVPDVRRNKKGVVKLFDVHKGIDHYKVLNINLTWGQTIIEN